MVNRVDQGMNLSIINHSQIDRNTDLTPSFYKLLKEGLAKIDSQQHEADKKIEEFLAGKRDVHEVMIALEEANLSFQFLMQVRNKLIEAYQEIMRMQI